MTSFVAVYHGETIRDAKMIAVSGNRDLVARVASELLDDQFCWDDGEGDPVLSALNRGRRQALQFVEDNAK